MLYSFKHKFRNKLFLSFFLIISLTVASMGITYYQKMKTELQTSTLQSLQRLTNQSVNTLDLYMRTLGNIGWDFFSDESLQKYLEHRSESSFDDQLYYRNKLEILTLQNPLISSITILDTNGNTISSNYSYNKQTRSLLEDEGLRSFHLAEEYGGKAVWTGSYTTTKSSVTPIKTISYVQQLKRITPYYQHDIGALKIDLDPVQLKSILQELHNQDGGDYYLVDSSAQVVFAAEEGSIGQSLADNPLYQAYLQNTGATPDLHHFDFVDESVSYIGFYRKLGLADWVLLGKMPMGQIMDKITHLANMTLLVGLVCFAFAMLVSSVISAGVTRPLKELSKNMRKVERGDFQAAIQVKSTDELGLIQHNFNKMTAEIRRLISKVYETELRKQEAEIKALQSQINPHFLYNTLGTIDSISSIDGDPRVGVICRSLGNLFRYNISGAHYATLEEELRQIEEYLTIHQIRYDSEFHYRIELECGLEHTIVPKFVLQPLVENAIIHGVELKRGDKRIELSVTSFPPQHVQITVADNGNGISPERLKALQRHLNEQQPWPEHPGSGRHSIGMQNVCSRIRLMYDMHPEFQISSEAGKGTCIRFILPKDFKGGGLNESHDRGR